MATYSPGVKTTISIPTTPLTTLEPVKTTISIPTTPLTTLESSPSVEAGGVEAKLQEFQKKVQASSPQRQVITSVGGMRLDKNSAIFAVAVVARSFQTAGLMAGTPVISNKLVEVDPAQQQKDLADKFLSVLGVTLSNEPAGYSLIATQTATTLITNPNISNPNLGIQDSVLASNQFPNVDDPIYTLDEEASVGLESDTGSSVSLSFSPDLTNLAASMAQGVQNSSPTSSSKYKGVK